ncbi:MAG: hypothetical protein ABJB32_04735 [Verrucomicrobiota bacterium]
MVGQRRLPLTPYQLVGDGDGDGEADSDGDADSDGEADGDGDASVFFLVEVFFFVDLFGVGAFSALLAVFVVDIVSCFAAQETKKPTAIRIVVEDIRNRFIGCR